MGGQSQGLFSIGIKLAGAALAGRLVSFGKKQATAGEKCIGVAFTDGVAGDFIPVTAVGSATVMSGGVIAFGDTLMSDANGCAVKYDGSGLKVGTAYEAASAAGQMIEMLCDTSAAENDVRAVVGLTGESRLQSAGINFPHISNARCLDPDKADGVVLPRCTTTSGSNVVNCPDGAFTSADVGKYFSLYSMDTASLTLTSKMSGTIIAVNSPTQFQASAAATATIATDTNGRCFYGTDRSADVQALLNIAAARGGFAQMPIGLIACASDIIVPGNVVLVGQGYDYPSTREFLSRGSALIRVGTFGSSGAFVTLGDTPNNYTPSKVKPQLLNIGIDAAERQDCVVMTNASRARIDHCTIFRGYSWGIKLGGAGDPWVTNNRVCQVNVGTCIDGTGDMHLFDNHIRGSGNGGHQIRVSAQSDFEISRNHIFKGGVGTIGGYSTLLGNNIYIQHTGFDATKHSNWSISENIFDGTAGHHILLNIGGTAATYVRGVRIQNNHFFQNSLPDNTYSFLHVDIANSSTLEMNVSGNTGIATLYNTDTNCYKNFAEVAGTGTIISNVSGNLISHCLAGCVGFTPTTGAGTNIMTSAANAPTTF